jgi:hypothetical protein
MGRGSSTGQGKDVERNTTMIFKRLHNRLINPTKDSGGYRWWCILFGMSAASDNTNVFHREYRYL